jgi:dipeptidyl aminopeptidase/acylaminoacyl peptidase
VTHTDIFKMAVAENTLTNWVSHVGTSDLAPGWKIEKLGIAPDELPDLYRRCSPITYAHRCKTPTLLILGEADYRCVAEQSEQFYTVLKANDCIVEMLRFPNSPHAGSRTGSLPVRRAQNEALLDWVNRYLNPI